jgi:preprotein translocase subunit YajC
MASFCLSYLSTGPIVLAADATGTEGLWQFVGLFVPLFAIWYFLVIMPQQRQRKKTQEMLGSLKTGDRVLTSGGIFGSIVSFRENTVKLEVAPKVQIDVTRSAITALQSVESDADASSNKESGKQQSAAKSKN